MLIRAVDNSDVLSGLVRIWGTQEEFFIRQTFFLSEYCRSVELLRGCISVRCSVVLLA